MAIRLGAIDVQAHPPRILHANCYAFGPGEALGPHFDEDVLVTVVDDGRGSIAIDRSPFEVERGDVLFAPWSAPVRYVADARRPLAITSLHLAFVPWSSPTPAARVPTRPIGERRRIDRLERPLQPWSEPLRLRDPGPLRELARRVVCAWAEQPRRDLQLRGLALELADALVVAHGRDAAAAASPHPHAAVVRGVASWMESNLSRPIRRAEIVARAGLDPTTLTAAFRAVLARSPIDWLIEARLREARALLRTTAAPVGEIGRRVGIPDPYYFSKLFRRRVGVAPLRYRAGG